jgi:putative addiction module component (TIGR02574 family)
MDSVIDDLKAQLAALAPGDRGALAHFLLSSLDPEEEGAEEAWDAEARRRVEEIRSGRAAGRPVDDFIAELRERYPSL